MRLRRERGLLEGGLIKERGLNRGFMAYGSFHIPRPPIPTDEIFC